MLVFRTPMAQSVVRVGLLDKVRGDVLAVSLDHLVEEFANKFKGGWSHSRCPAWLCVARLRPAFARSFSLRTCP